MSEHNWQVENLGLSCFEKNPIIHSLVRCQRSLPGLRKQGRDQVGCKRILFAEATLAADLITTLTVELLDALVAEKAKILGFRRAANSLQLDQLCFWRHSVSLMMGTNLDRARLLMSKLLGEEGPRIGLNL